MQTTRRDLMTAALAGSVALAATGAAPARAEALNAGGVPLGVGEFGIQPNSGEDEAARLMKAVETAAASGRPLSFPAGAFILGNLDFRGKNPHLLGVAGATRLKLAGHKHLIRFTGAAGVRLAGLTFEREDISAGKDAGLVRIEGGGVDIVDCQFLTSGGAALTLRQCLGTIAACTFGWLTDDAINASDCNGLTVRDNRFTSIAGSGIHLVSCSGPMIAGNRLEGTRAAAILAEASHDVLITGNLATGEGGGIHVRGSKGPTGVVSVVSGNLVRGRLLGNVVETPGGDGTGIHVELETQVAGNTVEGMDIGIRIGTGKQQGDVNCTGNLVRNCRVGIGVSGDFDAGYVAISSNFIGRHKDGAIRAMAGDKLIGPDLTRASAESYRSLSIFGNAAP